MQTAAWVAFLLGSAFVFYALIGYPLLLWVLARHWPKPVLKRFDPRTVTILLPVHNGEKWLRAKLDSILALNYPRDLIQTIVISDASQDGTDAIAGEFSASGIELIRVPKGGKAQALNKGLEFARGEILFFTDVRQKLDPECLSHLVACFADPRVGGACGELIIVDGLTQEEASVGLYWKIEKWIRRQLSTMGTLLVVTGCLYAIRRNLAEPVPAHSLGDDIFMPQAVLRKGYRVVFAEAAKAFDYPTAHDVEFGRKVRTLAALYQFTARHGLGSHWFHFFSYKVTRVLLPYALILVAAASFFLPSPVSLIAITAQALFYGIAAIDPAIPDRSPVKRISSPARTFCMLMAASLHAISIAFRPASELWRTTSVQTPKAHTDA
jgi:cellulose synthase/poly-beta-1,6-N-acetylglucosamine synthase-like glycosyltransferase